MKDGMAFGKDPGTLVFEDGTLYGPQTIEIDQASFERPIWRFRRRWGSSKQVKGIIPVRKAFEDFLEALSTDPIAASEWTKTSFHPPGSASDRSIMINLDEDSIAQAFFAKAPIWFASISRGEKVTWDEAAPPANFVPEGLSSIGSSQFVELFTKKEFSVSEGARILNSDRVLQIPKPILREEHGTRQNFLNCLNTMLATESLAHQFPGDGPLASALLSLLKQTLPPLWTAFGLFAKKKLQLRKLALKGCFNESLLYLKLLASNPLSPELFHPDALTEVTVKAENQGKSLLQILEFKTRLKKDKVPLLRDSLKGLVKTRNIRDKESSRKSKSRKRGLLNKLLTRIGHLQLEKAKQPLGSRARRVPGPGLQKARTIVPPNLVQIRTRRFEV